MESSILTAAILGVIVGAIIVASSIPVMPWQICTEAKAKNIELFSCNGVLE